MEIARARVVVTGRVQGVNFRSATRDQARAAGLAGWVCNREDGAVEAVFEGPRAAVDRLVSWCGAGPPHARVERVDVRWQAPTGAEEPFHVVW